MRKSSNAHKSILKKAKKIKSTNAIIPMHAHVCPIEESLQEEKGKCGWLSLGKQRRTEQIQLYRILQEKENNGHAISVE